jgi:hypothetical protein
MEFHSLEESPAIKCLKKRFPICSERGLFNMRVVERERPPLDPEEEEEEEEKRSR